MKEINKFWILFLLGFFIYILTDVLSTIYFTEWRDIFYSNFIPSLSILTGMGMIGLSFGFYIGRNLDKEV